MSLAAAERIAGNAHVRRSQTLLLYYALPDELDTTPLLELLSDKTILLPKVTGTESMELRIYTGEHDLATGSYGIREPIGRPFADLGCIDTAIIPGMAFDGSGNRLGRGKGYYDRLLSAMPQAYKIGLCFHFQFFDSIPFCRHDVRMDEVISV